MEKVGTGFISAQLVGFGGRYSSGRSSCCNWHPCAVPAIGAASGGARIWLGHLQALLALALDEC